MCLVDTHIKQRPVNYPMIMALEHKCVLVFSIIFCRVKIHRYLYNNDMTHFNKFMELKKNPPFFNFRFLIYIFSNSIYELSIHYNLSKLLLIFKPHFYSKCGYKIIIILILGCVFHLFQE